MTQITGKLYQMKNAAGSENRFPMTVIEGVYGLSTYLQQQFGSLADIYMPIEGIHEAKTGQEFVYRQTPNTINANYLNIDRIKGKTFTWNQLLTNGVGTISTPNTLHIFGRVELLSGHKYILSGTTSRGASAWGNIDFQVYIPELELYDLSGIGTSVGLLIDANSNTTIYVNAYSYGDITTPVSAWLSFIDLTLLGIDDLTTVEEVEAWLATNVGLRSYYPFNAGELKSNDAQSIVTVGRNQWDEEWESGDLNTNGEKTANNSYIRNKNVIPCLPNTEYYFYDSEGNQNQTAFFYDNNGGFLGYTTANIYNATFTTPANCKFMNFCRSTQTYTSDICINLSDAAFNGNYEPYWKSTIPLNIKTLTGKKDGQGASVTIFPDGAGGVGSVYDELRKSVAYKRFGIVDLGDLSWIAFGAQNDSFRAAVAGMKQTADTIVGKTSKYAPSRTGNGMTIYYATEDMVFVTNGGYAGGGGNLAIRDSSFANYTSSQLATALTGVKFIFELATPETYVLDTPLVLSGRAGTTEERISPNSDGLSAPFCGDLTYSVSAAADALEAQYAARAGQLLNTRKIWGNDFNGTQDVTGLATLGEGAKVSKVFTLPTTPPPTGSVASGEYALYVDPNGNYSQ